ncbi:unnamed protein product [Nesidiocoris tenuis]|uniref:Peroxin-7 n=2 Tax=Nesidiocoris tenuis TaxID=355587 RepID=A0A6H5GZH1_9HEMI|nr:WD domain, G-beta repeat [Nesidiocoris tenuis]CAB0010147.1 unnamed protein product [Nesidiocoris tenuis]
MPTYFTPNRHGYSVRFSQFRPDRIVCASSQHYGLAGGGTLFVLDVSPEGQILEYSKYDWSDGLFDVVWSETHPDIVVAASGDGILHVWNVSTPEVPAKTMKEHKKEIYSVDWSQTRQEQLVLSASWDCTIKLWDPEMSASLATYHGHSQLVYNAMWSPHVPSLFSSVSGDGTLKIWNAKIQQRAAMTVKAHDAEVLTCSWSKYDENLLATGGSDGLIRGWDIRSLARPIFQLRGCEYAVRRIQFSPHFSSVIASVSYDFTTRIWDYKASCDPVETINHHSEFVYGLDFNCHVTGQIADCGWDSFIHIFTPKSLKMLAHR